MDEGQEVARVAAMLRNFISVITVAQIDALIEMLVIEKRRRASDADLQIETKN
jgi:hypothetical protein